MHTHRLSLHWGLAAGRLGVSRSRFGSEVVLVLYVAVDVGDVHAEGGADVGGGAGCCMSYWVRLERRGLVSW